MIFVVFSLCSLCLIGSFVFLSLFCSPRWDLIAGISRNGTNGLVYSTSPYTSFSDRGASTNCEDPLNDDVYSMGGYQYSELENGNINSNQVWYSSNSINWEWRAGGFNETTGQPGPISFAPRFFSQCALDYNHQIIVTGGERQESFRVVLYNDVWLGRNGGRTWMYQTRVAPWAPRSEHAMLLHYSGVFARSIIWVMGGFLRVDEGAIQTSNDVWTSSDLGLTWARVTDRAPWTRRWGHAAAVTREGMLVVFGGSDSLTLYNEGMQTWRDGWISLDGGYQWWQLTLSGDTSFIRGEQGCLFTAEQRLILVSGYAYNLGQPRTDYADLWISNITFSSVTDVIRVTQGGTFLPTLGLGLRVWPGQSAPSEPLFGTVAITSIVVIVVLVVGIIAYCTFSRVRSGGGASMPSLSMPTFLSPRARRSQPASNGDYFTSQMTGGGGTDKFSYSDSSSISDHYQPPGSGGYNPPMSGGYHNGDSHGLLS